jgi:hypothetical protein
MEAVKGCNIISFKGATYFNSILESILKHYCVTTNSSTNQVAGRIHGLLSQEEIHGMLDQYLFHTTLKGKYPLPIDYEIKTKTKKTLLRGKYTEKNFNEFSSMFSRSIESSERYEVQ